MARLLSIRRDVRISNSGRTHQQTTPSEVLRRSRNSLYLVAYRVLNDKEAAEEAVHRCLMKAMSNMPPCQDSGAFASWLLRIVIDESIALVGKRKGAAVEGTRLSDRCDPLPRSESKEAEIPNAANTTLDYVAGHASRTVLSSANQEWPGILVEQRQLPPGERLAIESPYHLVWICTTPATGEYSDTRGRFVPFYKPSGSITITPRGIVPTVRSRVTMNVVLIALEPGYLEAIAAEMGHSSPVLNFRSGFQHRGIRWLGLLLRDELQAGGPTDHLYVDSLAHAIAINLLKVEAGRSIRRFDYRLTQMPSRILNRVVDYIEANLSSQLTLEDLATLAGYSRSHFLKVFRSSIGLTPHQYLLRRRIARAREFLLTGSKEIADVALECGFASQGHMTQVFRQQLGVTPGTFRRQLCEPFIRSKQFYPKNKYPPRLAVQCTSLRPDSVGEYSSQPRSGQTLDGRS